MVDAKRNFVGEVFGELLVVEQAEDHVTKGGRHRSRWKCLCNCGQYMYVTGCDLTKGNTNSCGCKRWEFFRASVFKGNEYIDCGDYYIGIDAKGEQFTFDKSDFDAVSQITWNVEITKFGYHRVAGHLPRGKRILLHQFLTGYEQTDHKDRNPTNNRRNNLRTATTAENARNISLNKNNTSGITGVTQRKDRPGKWIAVIGLNGKRYNLGTYANKDDAIKARLTKEKELFGDFAPQSHLYDKYGV